MSAMIGELWQRFRRYPRALRWALGGAFLIAVMLVWLDVILPRQGIWNDEADNLLARLVDSSHGEERLNRLERLEQDIRAIGPVEKPGTEGEATAVLKAAVNDILKRHKVSNDSYVDRPAGKLPRGTLAPILEGTRQAYSVSADLRFDATPEDAIAVIAELEGSPEVESVTRVRLARLGGADRKVTVDLTIDAWIAREERRPSSRGGA